LFEYDSVGFPAWYGSLNVVYSSQPGLIWSKILEIQLCRLEPIRGGRSLIEERYPPQDLIEWIVKTSVRRKALSKNLVSSDWQTNRPYRIKKKYAQEQQEKWEKLATTMKERKPHHKMNTNTKSMTRREQVVISHKPTLQ
jgi:hypothetical protein